jgi:hypothetical protein
LNPLEAATPAALFGAEAAADARALRRAYAALVRRWTPEEHPEVFQHIRALYEQAVRELERRADGPRASIPTGDTAAQLDAELAALSPDGVDALQAALEARAPHGDMHALAAAAAILEARAPERVPGYLVRLATYHPDAVAELAGALVAYRPTLVLDAAWPTLLESLPTGEPRRRLLVAEIDGLLSIGDLDLAWDRWEGLEGELRRAPDRWAALAVGVFRTAGPHRPVEQLDRWLEQIGSAGLDLSDPVAAALERVVCDALALGQARRDATVPHPHLDVVRELLTAAPYERVTVLGALGSDPGWRAWVDTLEDTHPGVASLLLRVVAGTTGRDVALRAWRDTGAPQPHPAVDLGPLRAAVEATRAEEKAEEVARWSVYQERQNRVSVRVGAGVLIGLVGGLVLDLAPFWAGLVVLACSGMVFVSGYRVSKGIIRPDVALRLGLIPAPETLPLRKRVVQQCREQGVWVHELAAAAREIVGLDEVLDALLADPLSDLEVIGPIHQRRAAAPPTEGGSR